MTADGDVTVVKYLDGETFEGTGVYDGIGTANGTGLFIGEGTFPDLWLLLVHSTRLV